MELLKERMNLEMDDLNKHYYPVMKKKWFLKWYYDQKIIPFFSSDFESVFA